MKLTLEHYRAMVFNDFKLLLNKEQCLQRLQLAYGNKGPSRATVFRW